jgi:hypothetical protein
VQRGDHPFRSRADVLHHAGLRQPWLGWRIGVRH